MMRAMLAALLIVAAEAHADCRDPVRAPVESEGGVTRTNSYTDGSTICITEFKPENDCETCVRGRYHTCGAGGKWRPSYQGECGAPAGSQGQLGSGAGAGAGAGSPSFPSSSGSGNQANVQAMLKRLRQGSASVQQSRHDAQQQIHGFGNDDEGGDGGGGAGAPSAMRGNEESTASAQDIESSCPGLMSRLTAVANSCSTSSQTGICETYRSYASCMQRAASTARSCSHPSAQQQAKAYQDSANDALQSARQACAN